MPDSQPLAFIIEDDKNLAHAFGQAMSDASYEVEVIRDGAPLRLQVRLPEVADEVRPR